MKRETLVSCLLIILQLCFLAHSVEDIVGLKCPLKVPERKEKMGYYIMLMFCDALSVSPDIKGLLCCPDVAKDK